MIGLTLAEKLSILRSFHLNEYFISIPGTSSA
jgi:hypothetical protein